MEEIEFTWLHPKNVPIYGRIWKPEFPAKAVVILVHGLGEHIGRYQHVAREFTSHSYGFIGADLIGHGKSGGQRGHADSFDDFYEIIDWLLTQSEIRFPGVPKILYGHSLGGNLVLTYALKRDPSVAGLIATSPGLEVTKVPPLKLAVGKMMYAVFPRLSMTNSLDVTGLSRDPAVVEAYTNDPLVHRLISARLGIDLLSEGEWLRNNSMGAKAPLLIAHGDSDRLVNITGTKDFVRQYQGDVTFIEFPGGYHELHNDIENQKLFTTIFEWLETRVLQSVK